MQRQYRPRLRSKPALLWTPHRRRASRAFVGLGRLRLLCALIVAASWGAAAPSESADERPADEVAPLLDKMLREHAATGQPTAYAPLEETSKTETNTKEEEQ